MGDALRIVHRRAARSQLGTASKTWAKTFLFGRLWAIEKPAVCLLGCSRRTNWAAINIGRRYAHEKDPVKTRVACRQRPIQPSMVFSCHGPTIEGRVTPC